MIEQRPNTDSSALTGLDQAQTVSHTDRDLFLERLRACGGSSMDMLQNQMLHAYNQLFWGGGHSCQWPLCAAVADHVFRGDRQAVPATLVPPRTPQPMRTPRHRAPR